MFGDSHGELLILSKPFRVERSESCNVTLHPGWYAFLLWPFVKTLLTLEESIGDGLVSLVLFCTLSPRELRHGDAKPDFSLLPVIFNV